VVVDGISQDRAGHGIIGPERCKAPSHRQRHGAWPNRLGKLEHELVRIRMRVTPVDKALTPVSRCQLAVGDGQPFEIDGREQAESAAQGSAMHHQGRLQHANLAECPAPGDRIRVNVGRHRVAAEAYPGCSLGPAW
jgi:hypothetical protein